MENNKKKLQIPSTCALLFMLMIVCAILTWIVPAGEFDTEKVGDLNKVIAGTYHTVEASPVGPWATIMAVVQGFYKAAKLMVMVMSAVPLRSLKRQERSTLPSENLLPSRT